jgi:hypothetical protein
MHKKQLIIICVMALLFAGCAAGSMCVYTYDPSSKKSTKTEYSSLFLSDSTSFAEGAEFTVSVVNTRRVEPISYGLLGSIGGLTSDDLESKATVVVHFKNDSQQAYRINLKKITILKQDFIINFPEIVLDPGDRFDTKVFSAKIPTYDTSFELDLFYELKGRLLTEKFTMSRQTIEELNKRRKSSVKK